MFSPHRQDEGVCPPDVCVLSLLEDGGRVQIVSQLIFIYDSLLSAH